MSLSSIFSSSSVHPSAMAAELPSPHSTKTLKQMLLKSKANFTRFEKWEFSHYREGGLLGWVARLILFFMPALKSQLAKVAELEIALLKKELGAWTPSVDKLKKETGTLASAIDKLKQIKNSIPVFPPAVDLLLGEQAKAEQLSVFKELKKTG